MSKNAPRAFQSIDGGTEGRAETRFLRASVRQAHRQMVLLNRVSAILNDSQSLNTVLEGVAREVSKNFGFNATRIFLHDRRRDRFMLRGSFSADPDRWSGVRSFQLGKGNVGRVGETGKPIVFANVQEDPEYERMSRTRKSRKEGYRFFGAFPIKSRLATVGAIVCIGGMPRRLRPSEQKLICSVANQVGVAFENARLIEEARSKVAEFTALHSISTIINEPLDLDQVLRKVMHRLMEIFGADAARVYSLDETENALRLHTCEGLPGELVVKDRYEPREGITGSVFASGRPLSFGDALTSRKFQRLSRLGLGLRHVYRRQLYMPISVKNRTLGVMNFLTKAPRPFTSTETQLIRTIANHLGMAFENAKLFTEVTDKVAELETLNRELHAANRIKTEFMESVSHELRTPLTAIIGYTSLLADGYGGGVNGTQCELLESVRHNAAMLLSLIKNILALASLDARKMPVRISEGRVEDVLHHLRMYTTHLNVRPDLEIVWEIQEGLPSIVTDYEKLEEILQNLINNAYKFTPRGRITIRVRDLRKQCRLEFSVADTGIGIEDLQKVFDRFQQGPLAHLGDFRGMGLGLSIVKEFLDLIEGELHLESRPGTGSNFTFTIPYSIQRH